MGLLKISCGQEEGSQKSSLVRNAVSSICLESSGKVDPLSTRLRYLTWANDRSEVKVAFRLSRRSLNISRSNRTPHSAWIATMSPFSVARRPKLAYLRILLLHKYIPSDLPDEKFLLS